MKTCPGCSGKGSFGDDFFCGCCGGTGQVPDDARCSEPKPQAVVPSDIPSDEEISEAIKDADVEAEFRSLLRSFIGMHGDGHVLSVLRSRAEWILGKYWIGDRRITDFVEPVVFTDPDEPTHVHLYFRRKD